MAFVEDLTPFLADFGDAGTLDGAAVRGIYDAPALMQGMGEIAVTAAEPQFQLPTAQVPVTVFGKVLAIPQGTFSVREHLPDGTGMSLLLLTKA